MNGRQPWCGDREWREAAADRHRAPRLDGKPVTYGIRPEHLEFADDGIEAEVVVVEPTGSETQVVARIGTQDIIAVIRDRRPVEAGRQDHAAGRVANSAHLFDKETGKRLIN